MTKQKQKKEENNCKTCDEYKYLLSHLSNDNLY